MCVRTTSAMGCSDLKYAWPSSVNVANSVTVKPCVEGDERNSNFKIWKEQMLNLLERHDVVGFVDGEILPPGDDDEEQKKLWRRTDMLVQGWILGSIGKDALDAVWDKSTANEIWLALDNIFKEEEDEEEEEKDKENSEEEEYSRYLTVYQAAQRGDWDTAKDFFQDINELSTTRISSDSKTALHVAVLTGKANEFVKKLVEMMPHPHDALKIKNLYGKTALHGAANVGNTAAAAAMVNKNRDLLHILSDSNVSPVLQAALSGRKETLEYLISEHEAEEPKPLTESRLDIQLLNVIIDSEFVDIALYLVQKYPNLTLQKYDGRSPLLAIAETGTLFPKTETFSWWQTFIYHRLPLKSSKSEAHGAAHKNCSIYGGKVVQKLESVIWCVIENSVPKVKELREKKARRQQALQVVEYLCSKIKSELPGKEALGIFSDAIITAAENGISEIVEMIIHKFPMVTFDTDVDMGRNVFQLAAGYRFENVFNLIYSISDRKYLIYDSEDNELNNLLHICGALAPPDRLNLVAGAALQMQRELQWFKEMENYVHPSRRTWKNNKSQTPQMIFTKEHEKLKADGEKWMKDTANAYTVAAALIATVVFAAALTVPGGLESGSGKPLLSSEPAFALFAVADAISLFTSITSLLMFLSILTSRYAEQDFLHVLPKRLSIGLLSLFVSITFMMVAFSATLYLVFRKEVAWFLALLAAFACFPVTSFVLLQFPLLVDVIYSTYGPGIFGKKGHLLLY